MLDDLMQIFAGIFGNGATTTKTPREVEQLHRTGTVRSALRTLDGDLPGPHRLWVRGEWTVRRGALSFDGITVPVQGVLPGRRRPTKEEQLSVPSLSEIIVLDCGTGRAEWAVKVTVREEALKVLLGTAPHSGGGT